jgi:hypothetical protein
MQPARVAISNESSSRIAEHGVYSRDDHDRVPSTTVLDIYDTKVPRLVLRAPFGQALVSDRLGRGRWYTLGGTALIRSPAIARNEAQKPLREYASGADPRIATRGKTLTVDGYLMQVYGRLLGRRTCWLMPSRRGSAAQRRSASAARRSVHSGCDLGSTFD